MWEEGWRREVVVEVKWVIFGGLDVRSERNGLVLGSVQRRY